MTTNRWFSASALAASLLLVGATLAQADGDKKAPKEIDEAVL